MSTRSTHGALRISCRKCEIDANPQALHPGGIVVIDNLSLHKVSGIVNMIKSVGASVKLLPPCSPDLNPIEFLWPKMKAILRKLKTHLKEHLDDAIAFALRAITIQDISNWF